MLRDNSISAITTIAVLVSVVLLVRNSEQRTAATPVVSDEEIARQMSRDFREFRDSAKKPGLEIWRVEKFKLRKLDAAEHGKFHSGDSYLVLETKLQNQKLLPKIYYWIGKSSTQDEYGAVALYATHLRQHLNNQPSTNREEQAQESADFQKLFPKRLVYLDGGIESGFRHVNPAEFEKKLYLVKGKRNIRVQPVPLTADSLNQNDSFVLDTAKHIYIFNGKYSSNLERLKSQTFSSRLADDHSGRATKIEIDENNFGTLLKEINAAGKKGAAKVAVTTTNSSDIDFEKNFVQNLQLIRVSEKDQRISIDKVAEKQLNQMQLQTDDCFVVKDGDRALFVWIGKRCNSRERAETQKRFANAKKVLEKSEPASFTEYFHTWKAAGEQNARLI